MNHPDPVAVSAEPPRKVNWPSVALYYFTACAISWPLFWWRDLHPDSWQHWALRGLFKGLLPALGPLTGCLLALLIFRRAHRRTISLLGTSVVKSALFAAIPLGVLAALGVGDSKPHLTGAVLGCMSLVYAIGEEAGWRGFLHDALRPLGDGRRALIIGLLWGTWHFTTFVSGGFAASAGRLAIMYCAWIAASWLMGKAADLTRSLVVAAMLHLVFNFVLGFPPKVWITVLAVSIPCWVYLLFRWRRGSAGEHSAILDSK
jgi:hypothetical protein